MSVRCHDDVVAKTSLSLLAFVIMWFSKKEVI